MGTAEAGKSIPKERGFLRNSGKRCQLGGAGKAQQSGCTGLEKFLGQGREEVGKVFPHKELQNSSLFQTVSWKKKKKKKELFIWKVWMKPGCSPGPETEASDVCATLQPFHQVLAC